MQYHHPIWSLLTSFWPKPYFVLWSLQNTYITIDILHNTIYLWGICNITIFDRGHFLYHHIRVTSHCFTTTGIKTSFKQRWSVRHTMFVSTTVSFFCLLLVWYHLLVLALLTTRVVWSCQGGPSRPLESFLFWRQSILEGSVLPQGRLSNLQENEIFATNLLDFLVYTAFSTSLSLSFRYLSMSCWIVEIGRKMAEKWSLAYTHYLWLFVCVDTLNFAWNRNLPRFSSYLAIPGQRH